MLRFTKGRPSEFLVIGRRGNLRNIGVGVGAWIGPGTSFVRVPTGKEEACFAMVQSTADGIPLQFKGSAVYRVVDPVAAALSFDFVGGSGPERLRGLVASVCLGELRDVVSRMTMEACIEGRKTTLTRAVEDALTAVVGGTDDAAAWGISIDVVLVAQVFVIDQELRTRLETEERAAITARSRRAEIQRDEQIEGAELESSRRLAAERLNRERESNSIARESLKFSQALELERQASKAHVQLEALAQRTELERQKADTEATRLGVELENDAALQRRNQDAEAQRRRERLAHEMDVAEMAVEAARQGLELHQIEVERDMLRARADAELERDLLPQRQLPEIAKSLSGLYDGATLSVWGTDDRIAGQLLPLVDLVMQRIRQIGGGNGS